MFYVRKSQKSVQNELYFLYTLYERDRSRLVTVIVELVR